MVMSSAKKSGRTPKRPGHSTRSLPAPVPGSAWTETSPRLMRNLPATSAPFAVLKVASRHAPPLVFSTRAMRSRRAAGSPAAVSKRSRSRATAPPGFTAWTSTAESCLRSTATIRPLLRTASPLKESAVSPSGNGGPVVLARQGRRRQRFRGRPARVPDGDAGLRLGRGGCRRIGTPGPTRPRQRHEKCGNSDNRKPTHEASPCSRALQETAVLPPPIIPGRPLPGNRSRRQPPDCNPAEDGCQ